MRSVADILNAISDDKSLLLFNTIAVTNGETEIQVRRMGLTLKQYYSRMAKLTKADLVTSSTAGLPKEELSKLVDTLIDDYQIKDILMKTPLPTEDQKSRESTPQITTGAKEKMRLEKLASYR